VRATVAASTVPIARLTEPVERLAASVPAPWQAVLQPFFSSAPGRALSERLSRRLAEGAVIFPPDPFRALRETLPTDVRVVILGQDPYHGAGQAEGLAFSVPAGVKPPPSLRNIFVELNRDLGLPMPTSGHLGGWARQGVLLLNTSLTVEEGQAGSHARWGWDILTDGVIALIAEQPASIVFMLWGAHAQSKYSLISERGEGRHLILQANHPSPLSARRPPMPFIGCGHFSQVVAAGVPVAWEKL